MFRNPYIRLENGKSIKLENLEIEPSENDEEVMVAVMFLDPIYVGFFNSQKTTIKSVFFKGLFRKSRELALSMDSVPSFKLVNNQLILAQELERI